MLRIGLIYMNASNLGDVVIFDCVCEFLKNIFAERQENNYELVPINIDSQCRHSIYYGVKRRLMKLKYQRMLEKGKSNEELDNLLLQRWHISRAYRYFEKNEKKKIDNLDLIIFVGGGMIKFHRQECHYFLHEIIGIAQEKNIPVMLNAVGVEGYNEKNRECQILKNAINKDCVRYISTRDDLDTLRTNYITNSKIISELVCDPAIWSKECYTVERNDSSKKIGLGVIRPEIFSEYLYHVDRKALINLYAELCKRILDSGYSVEFFSNGMMKDNKFIEDILHQNRELRETQKVSVAIPKNAKHLIEIIAQYERCVVARMHASIIACSLGVPNVSLVWNNKQTLLGKTLKLEENYVTKENFNAECIYDKLFAADSPIIDEKHKKSVYEGLKNQIIQIIEDRKNDF